MMNRDSFLSILVLPLLLFSIWCNGQKMDWQTPYEQNENYSATYQEVIAYYEKLAKQYPQLKLETHGSTDSGHPLHTAILSKDQDFDPASNRAKGRVVLFINNGIHPGEPCGIDATLMLLRDYLQDPNKLALLDHVVIVFIPVYNIGGALNRGSFSRANQLGPEAYGFRGNAKNLDLNRDFIKCDSKNAQTFNQIYNKWLPEIFIDNHTSNGADYQYTMTLIATQHNKLHPILADYMQNELLPHLYRGMQERGMEMTPYVYARDTPDQGIAGFLDLPRYSSGYAALHHAISFMPETHMLKPFKDRVKSTYYFMDCMIKTIDQDYQKIIEARTKLVEEVKAQTTFPINWSLDSNQADTITFKGYEAKYKASAISGLDRLYYDRNAPFEKEIPYFNHYTVTSEITKPIAYVIPQAYSAVIDRLQWNGVAVQRLQEDQELKLDFYYIKDYKTRQNAYESHYIHSQVEVETKAMKRQFYKGDYVVYTNQAANRYILETLEPQAPDSYFAWNFFDGILMQKEYFSSYVFEDLALKYLEENPDLKAALEVKKEEDEEFAASARAQLDFIYKRSPHYEATHNLYPIGRMVKPIQMSLTK